MPVNMLVVVCCFVCCVLCRFVCYCVLYCCVLYCCVLCCSALRGVLLWCVLLCWAVMTVSSCFACCCVVEDHVVMHCIVFCSVSLQTNSKKHSFSTLLTTNLQHVHKYWQLRTVCTGQRLVMDAVALDDWCSSFEMSRSHSTSYCRGREIAESKDQHLMRLTFLCNVQ